MGKKELDRYMELVPDDACKKEQLLVYRYNGVTYIGLFLFCFGWGLFMLVGAIINFASRGWELGFVLLFSTAMFMTLGIVFWLYITRCVLIFYPGGLVYRNLRGEVYAVADEDVLYVMSLGFGKNRCFRIKTKERTITWSVHARRFYEAERYALERYPDWDSYEMQNKL